VGGPADVTETGSMGDRKRPITEGGDSFPGCGTKRRRFPDAGRFVAPRVTDRYLDRIFEETERYPSQMIKFASFQPQDIPRDVKHQRSSLQGFNSAWKKDKFGLSEETEDTGTSAASAALKMPTPIDTRLNCEKLHSASENIVSSCRRLWFSLKVFATEYPKHKRTCAEFTGYFHKLASAAYTIWDASRDLAHHLKLSSVESAVYEIDSRLTELILEFQWEYLQFHNLYSKYMNPVWTRDGREVVEEFPLYSEEDSVEIHISAFINMAAVNVDKLNEISGKIDRHIQSLSEPVQGEVFGHFVSEQAMEVRKSDRTNIFRDVHEFIITFEKDMLAFCDLLSGFWVPGSYVE
jgi:hypothetical protein